MGAKLDHPAVEASQEIKRRWPRFGPLIHIIANHVRELEAEVERLKDKHKQAMHEEALSWNATVTDWANRAEAAEAKLLKLVDMFTYEHKGKRFTMSQGDADVTAELEAALK